MKCNNVLIALVVSSMLLSGCNSVSKFLGKRDNGSLAYQQSGLLPAVKLPADKQTQPFTPLYPIVEVPKSQINVIDAKNQSYKLPRPNVTTK